jgi:phosphoglycolate phosphatase-like HAD superfamily hydrolase
MLVLFDIDATLLRTEGAGIRAMMSAAEELFPGRTFSFAGIEVSGRLDTLIWREFMLRHGIEPTDDLHEPFRRKYGEHLQRRFAGTCRSVALPGARALVDALHGAQGVDLGIVTGNYEHTGTLKVAKAGFTPEVFCFNGWADDGEHRRDLPRVAMDRHESARGRRLSSDRVTVIGDTPHDIDCARHNGCRSIAVATGIHPEAELAEHKPDLLLKDLDDWQSVVSWIACR